MAGTTTVWGIDIGRCVVRAIKLRPGADGAVEIIGYEYIQHPTILSRIDGDPQQKIVEALEQFLSRNDISKDKLVVGVPGQHTLARFSKLPPVETKKIPDIVRYEADQQIPFDLDEVIWDYQTFQEEGSPDVEVGIFAMKWELIRDYLLPLDRLDLEPIVVQSGPLALYNAMKFDKRVGDETTVLLDVGAENTDLIVATDFGLWTRTIPVGGNKFTEALVKAFKLSFSKAEGLKRTAATSKYARQVFQAMRPVFAELVQELSRSLGFYRSTHREAKLKRLIGVGGAFKLPGLQKYLQQNLQIPVERPASIQSANVVEVPDRAKFDKQIHGAFVAYGLALQGLEQSKAATGVSAINSNLLPPEIVKQVVWRRKKPYFAAAAACLLMAAGVIWFRQTSDMSTLTANEGQPAVKIQYARAAQILQSGPSSTAPPREAALTMLAVYNAFDAESKKYRNEGAEEQQKSAALVKLQQNKAVWPKILAAVHSALPQPQAPLAGAEDAGTYSEAAKDIPRPKRNQIFIEEFLSEYKADVDDVKQVDLIDAVEGVDIDSIEKPDDEVRDGFLITLQCRTPRPYGGVHTSETVRFVADTIKRDLRVNGRQPNLGFYINRVALVGEGARFAEYKRADRGRGKGSGRGRGGRPPGRGKPRSPKRSTGDTKYDPVTNESMDDDWMFQIQFDVVLRDLPESPDDGDDA